MQTTATLESSPAIRSWDEQFKATGRVVITQQSWQMVAIFVGLWVIAMVALYVGVEDIDMGAYRRVGVTMALFFVLLLTWYFIFYRHRTVVIDGEGIHLTDSIVVPWGDAVSAHVIRQRNRAAVGLTVTSGFWDVYRAGQHPVTRMLSSIGSAFIQPNTLYFPQTLDVDTQEFVMWLDSMIARHASTTPAPREPRSPVWYDAVLGREGP